MLESGETPVTAEGGWGRGALSDEEFDRAALSFRPSWELGLQATAPSSDPLNPPNVEVLVTPFEAGASKITDAAAPVATASIAPPAASIRPVPVSRRDDASPTRKASQRDVKSSLSDRPVVPQSRTGLFVGIALGAAALVGGLAFAFSGGSSTPSETPAAQAPSVSPSAETPAVAAPEPPPAPVVAAPEPPPAPAVAAPEPPPAPVVAAPEPPPAPVVAAPEPPPAPVVAAPEPPPASVVAAPEPPPAPVVAAPAPPPAPVVAAPAPPRPRAVVVRTQRSTAPRAERPAARAARDDSEPARPAARSRTPRAAGFVTDNPY